MDSMVSCIRGRGNASFLVLAFNFLKSMQNRRVPSFFLTRTMVLHQGDFEGQMASPSNMSCRFSQTSSNRGGAIRWNLSLNGTSSISSMMLFCRVRATYLVLIQGERYGDVSINIRSNFKASSDGHSLSCSSLPSCHNNSIRSFCCSSMVSLGASFPWASANSLANSGFGHGFGHLVGSGYLGHASAGGELDCFAGKVPEDHGHIPTTILQLRVGF